MPFKSNADRRHHIPEQRHRVTNWASYEAGLRARGSLTVGTVNLLSLRRPRWLTDGSDHVTLKPPQQLR